ncbi:MAG: MFS transporter, partial [Verrucomicrobia bacterium]
MTSKERSAFLYAAIVAMGGFIFGLDAALISGTVGYITREFSLTDVQLGMAVSAPGFGVLVALPIAGVMANRLGRKRALQVIAALYLVSAGWSAFAPSFVHLVAARFLGGLAFTSIAMAAMYIGEIAPPRWRGKLVSMTQINIVIGLSGAYFINYLIQQASQSDARWVEVLGLSQYTWRWMLGSEILPALLWFALLAIIPESPYWLVYANRLDAARATLRRILPAEQIERHISEMLESMRLSHQESVHTFGTQLREIFSARMRVIFIIAITLAIAQQSTGINAIMFYATTVIEQLGIGTDAAFMQAIWFGITSVVFTVIGLLLVDRLGRRPLILWG